MPFLIATSSTTLRRGVPSTELAATLPQPSSRPCFDAGQLSFASDPDTGPRCDATAALSPTAMATTSACHLADRLCIGLALLSFAVPLSHHHHDVLDSSRCDPSTAILFAFVPQCLLAGAVPPLCRQPLCSGQTMQRSSLLHRR
ncbi:unnamed protein product [Miscanthus lutarioriparius]|uniref:Uncharacterized protein n=1 Tax=Miscanthus lutarioriparius TaxID=422564 RepID=A0A811P173_9POAL|nr:unnamed protein product [Miscanthus lutarioriparius]